jgi:hypothetical protein
VISAREWPWATPAFTFGSSLHGILSRVLEESRLLTAAALILGLLLLVVAVIYWAEPAGSLPVFFPGHQTHSAHHHVKHGIAAFLVGLAVLAFAWFQSAKKAPSHG